MNKNLTEIIYILDRSGSMSGLEKDTIGGYNGFLEKQKKEEGDAVVTTVLFDDKYELVHDRADIGKVSPLTDKEYFARGMTALFDAVGRTLKQVENRHKNALENEVPAKTVVIITTDGYENASREFKASAVKGMIENLRKEKGWEFLFLGANIDAIEAAENIGISKDYAATYHADSVGTSLNFEAVNGAVSRIRSFRPLSSGWKKRVDEYANSKKSDE